MLNSSQNINVISRRQSKSRIGVRKTDTPSTTRKTSISVTKRKREEEDNHNNVQKRRKKEEKAEHPDFAGGVPFVVVVSRPPADASLPGFRPDAAFFVPTPASFGLDHRVTPLFYFLISCVV